MPSQSAYSRYSNKFCESTNNEIFPDLQNWLLQMLEIESFTVDFVSTVIPRHGEQKRIQPKQKGPRLVSSTYGLYKPDKDGGECLA